MTSPERHPMLQMLLRSKRGQTLAVFTFGFPATTQAREGGGQVMKLAQDARISLHASLQADDWILPSRNDAEEHRRNPAPPEQLPTPAYTRREDFRADA